MDRPDTPTHPGAPDKLPRRINHVEGEPGSEGDWSTWVHPLPGYRMICCDCGLSHEMQFDVVESDRVIFRARRHARSTAQVRRYMRKKASGDAR